MDVLPAGGDHDAYLRDALARWLREVNPSTIALHDPYLCCLRPELDEASAIHRLDGDALYGWVAERGVADTTHLGRAADLVEF